MSGQDGIENRAEELIDGATEEVVLVIGDGALLTDNLVETLNSVGNDVELLIGAIAEPLEDRIQTAVPDAKTFISGLGWLLGGDSDKNQTSIGRLLLVDRSAILLSSIMSGTKEEKAIFGEGFGNGLVVISRRIMSQGLLTARDPAT